ncbi:hypothetical protein [Zavarzinia aquatilis]|nr:hypothetical protein [Zavarzinia aquatilis]
MIDAAEDGDRAFLVEAGRYVRHIQSGMLCTLDRASLFTLTRLLVFPTESVGDDVGCDHTLPDGKLTVFATRKHGLSLDDYVAGTVNSMLRMFPQAKPRDTIALRHKDLNPPRAASFDVTLDGRPYVTTAWIAEEGDWFVTVRSTYPAEAGNLMEMQSAAAIMPASLSIRAAEGR